MLTAKCLVSRLFHQSVNLKEDALVKRQKKWFQFLWDLVISSFVPLLPICKQKNPQSNMFYKSKLYVEGTDPYSVYQKAYGTDLSWGCSL